MSDRTFMETRDADEETSKWQSSDSEILRPYGIEFHTGGTPVGTAGNRVSQVLDIPADMLVIDDSTDSTDDRYRSSAERVVERAVHVLRGGTWTSPPTCPTTFYRGKDLITGRHHEVGFRCAYETSG
jgi:hypothetical protein